MKKIVALICVFLLIISCSSDESEPPVYRVILPIENVTVPEVFHVGVQNEIIIEYVKPSKCHGFDGFYFQKEGFTRTLAVQNFVVEKNDCQTLLVDIQSETFSFQPTEPGDYTFKFWKGKDSAGNDTFLEHVIPAVTN